VDEEAPYIEEAEWVLEVYHEPGPGRPKLIVGWAVSGFHKWESGKVKPKTLTDCIALIQHINAVYQTPETGGVSPDLYRLRHFKNKKDVIPAAILIAM